MGIHAVGGCAAALTVLVLAAGCGEDRGPSERDPAAPATVRRSVPWTLVRVDGERIVIAYRATSCGTGDPAARARVDQAAGAVTVQVVASVVEASPCAGVELGGRIRVDLARPLGERRLRHGPVSPSQRAAARPPTP